MYDTINLWLSSELTGSISLTDYAPQFLDRVTPHQSEDGQPYINGYLDNYKVSVSGKGISLKGSLAKYFLPDNFHTLTRSDSARAIEKMADELHLPMHQAKVSRIDFAQNFLMDYEPEAYYNYLGECLHYNRQPLDKSLYYRNGLRQKLFYNKIAEGKKKKMSLPDVWHGQNVLRYELRFMSRLPDQFNLPKITASTLSNEKFYMGLVSRWIAEYEQINKLNLINFNLSDMNSPKDFFKQLALSKINDIGQSNVMQLVEDLRARKAFDKPEYYSRLKKEIRQLCKTPDLTTSSDMVAELDKKISAAKRYYR